MTPPAAFRVVIASLGLAHFLWGVLYLFDAVSYAIGLAKPLLHTPAHWYAVRGIFQMLLGFLLIGGIPQLIRLAFPAEVAELESDEDEGEPTSSPPL